MAVATDTAMWIGRLHEYTLELRSPDGALRRRIERGPKWFTDSLRTRRPFVEFRRTSVDRRPAIQAIHDDGHGHIWVVGHTLSRFLAMPRAGEPVKLLAGLEALLTILEVLDADTGALLATASFEKLWLPQFTPDGLLYTLSRDEDDLLKVKLYRPRLAGHVSDAENAEGR